MKDRRMWIVFLIVFVNMLGFGIILPLLPYYVESFGAGVLVVGLLSTTYSFFQLLSAPVLGEVSDKLGRRPVLLFSISGTALSFVIMGLARSVPMLFAARIVDGISGGNIATAQAYIADITTKENRTQGMGVMIAAYSTGMIVGPAFGGILSVYGYSVPAYVAGAFALAATILTFFFLPESRRAHSGPAGWKARFFNIGDFYHALTHPEVGFLLTISFMALFAFSLMQGIFSLFTEHTLRLTARDNGIIFAYLGVVGVIMQVFILRRLLKAVPERRAAGLGIAGVAVSLGMIAMCESIPLLLVSVTLLAVSVSIAWPVVTSLISKKTPEDEQGNVAGMSQSVASMAQLLGPVAGSYIYSTAGARAPLFAATAILTVTALLGIRRLMLSR